MSYTIWNSHAGTYANANTYAELVAEGVVGKWCVDEGNAAIFIDIDGGAGLVIDGDPESLVDFARTLLARTERMAERASA